MNAFWEHAHMGRIKNNCNPLSNKSATCSILINTRFISFTLLYFQIHHCAFPCFLSQVLCLYLHSSKRKNADITSIRNISVYVAVPEKLLLHKPACRVIKDLPVKIIHDISLLVNILPAKYVSVSVIPIQISSDKLSFHDTSVVLTCRIAVIIFNELLLQYTTKK